MEDNSPSTSQVLVIGNIEYLIETLFSEPNHKFGMILELIDQNNIPVLEDIMQYLHSLLRIKGYPDYAVLFAERYKLQVENTPSDTSDKNPLQAIQTDIMKNLTTNMN